jgi:hypothetical protein
VVAAVVLDAEMDGRVGHVEEVRPDRVLQDRGREADADELVGENVLLAHV